MVLRSEISRHALQADHLRIALGSAFGRRVPAINLPTLRRSIPSLRVAFPARETVWRAWERLVRATGAAFQVNWQCSRTPGEDDASTLSAALIKSSTRAPTWARSRMRASALRASPSRNPRPRSARNASACAAADAASTSVP
jgi:hypothetical protein